jgi:hypothetical protein
MGLEVFLKPSVGSRQYGVDVGAFGKLSSESESKVYLFKHGQIRSQKSNKAEINREQCCRT